MTNSRDYDRILWAWKGWHDATGPKMRKAYTEVVTIQNKGAKYSNYKDLSERWIEDFEDPNFEKDIDSLLKDILPLYQQVHAYARRVLFEKYGKKYPKNFDDKYIPAHLLGNMWGQAWNNIYDILVPYPEAKPLDLTEILISKNYTAKRIFDVKRNYLK